MRISMGREVRKIKKFPIATNSIPLVTNATQKSIDINIYGPVVDSSWWDDGVTTPQQIQDALKSAGNIGQINVHINSPGGSVFAGQAIHNMLKQHPANVTVHIDGLAASIASIIAMSGNKIIMPPGSMMMIHNPLVGMYGSYEASEMRETANFLDKIKESLVATYTSRQTKKSKDEIVALMDATTWLTAQDALDSGFADEVEGIAPVNSTMTGKVLNIAGMAFNLESFGTLPVNMITALPEIPINKTEEENILNLTELKAKYPDLYNEIIAMGVTQERGRMKALDDVQIDGFENIVNKARYESGATAEQVAMQIIVAQKQQSADYLKNVKTDVVDSNLLEVPGTPAPDNKASEEAEIKASAELIAQAANVGRDK